MMELILLPIGFATGWQVAMRTTTDTPTAMLALAIATAIAVLVWLPVLQAALAATGLAIGFAARRLRTR